MAYSTQHVTEFCRANAISYKRVYRSVSQVGTVRIKLYDINDVEHNARLLQVEFGRKAIVKVTSSEGISSVILLFNAI